MLCLPLFQRTKKKTENSLKNKRNRNFGKKMSSKLIKLFLKFKTYWIKIYNLFTYYNVDSTTSLNILSCIKKTVSYKKKR